MVQRAARALGTPCGAEAGKGAWPHHRPWGPCGVPEDICRRPPTCPACGAWGAPVAPVSPPLPPPCPSKRARCENWGHGDWGPAWRGWWLGWSRPGAGCACTVLRHPKTTTCSGFPHLPQDFLSVFYCSKSPKKNGGAVSAPAKASRPGCKEGGTLPCSLERVGLRPDGGVLMTVLDPGEPAAASSHAAQGNSPPPGRRWRRC